MTNDEILIKYNTALTGHWRYESSKINLSGWFYTDNEIKQPEDARVGNFAGKNIATREPVYFDYKLFFEFGECYLQFNKKKYRVKSIDRDKKKAEMILINSAGKEELWYWEEH